MAIVKICDGCRGAIEGEGNRVGFVICKDYCDECAPKVAAYGAEIDAVHTKAAAVFTRGLEAIRAKYRKRGLAELPDTANE